MNVKQRWVRRAGHVAVGLFLVLGALGCSSEAEPVASDTSALFLVPETLDELAGEHFLDHPLPSDFRRDEAGAPVFKGFHNPRQSPLLQEYVDVSAGLLDGFSPVASGYLRFNTALDATSLPQTPASSLEPAASVQLIDVDPESPEVGTRHLLTLSFRAEPGAYVVSNTLRWMPTLGFPLRASTTYAVVVTRAARTTAGSPVVPSPHLEEVLGLLPAEGARAVLRDAWAPAVTALGSAGVAVSDIAHLSVFTTSDPVGETILVADHLRQNVDPPTFAGAWVVVDHPEFVEYENTFGPSPSYQVGEAPYRSIDDGGQFNIVDGVPQVVRNEDLRFSLAVPRCDMPASGYPIVLFAHGTGGSWKSYINGGYAATLADKCIATMGVDQIFHGTRTGAPENDLDIGLVFFNFQNVLAARTNGRQSAIDEVQRARLFTEGAATIPAATSHTGEIIRFDPDRVMFLGHSQGGLNGPMYLAVDDSALGGVLSGSGSVIQITLLEKTEPAPSIPDLTRSILLGLTPEEYGEYDVFHPALSLAQTLIDPVDPINYAHLLTREPRAGFTPKSVLMTEGIAPDGTGDNFSPPKGIEAQAIAMGLPLQLPATRPYEQLEYGAPSAVTIPPEGLRGNLGGGAASGVLAQWEPPAGEDGHFVIFDVPQARAQVAEFLAQLANDPVGLVPPP
jgi:hypothetical protein